MTLSGSSNRRNLKDIRDTLESLKSMIKELKRGRRRLRSQIQLAVRKIEESKRMKEEACSQLSSAFKHYADVEAMQPQGSQDENIIAVDRKLISIPLLTISPDVNFLVRYHEETNMQMTSAMSEESLSSPTPMESLNDSAESLVESIESSMEADDSSVDDFGGPSMDCSDSSEEDFGGPSMDYRDSSDEDSEEPSMDVNDSSEDEYQEIFWAECSDIKETDGVQNVSTSLEIKDIVTELKKTNGNFQEVCNEFEDTSYVSEGFGSSWLNKYVEKISEDEQKTAREIIQTRVDENSEPFENMFDGKIGNLKGLWADEHKQTHSCLNPQEGIASYMKSVTFMDENSKSVARERFDSPPKEVTRLRTSYTMTNFAEDIPEDKTLFTNIELEKDENLKLPEEKEIHFNDESERSFYQTIKNESETSTCTFSSIINKSFDDENLKIKDLDSGLLPDVTHFRTSEENTQVYEDSDGKVTENSSDLDRE